MAPTSTENTTNMKGAVKRFVLCHILKKQFKLFTFFLFQGSPVKEDKKSKEKEKKEKKKGGIRTSFFSKKKSKNKDKDEPHAVAASN